MSLLRLCPQCGRTVTKTGLCDDCKRADNKRRNRKRVQSGRTTQAWQRLRLAAMHRDNFTCQWPGCGKTGTRFDLTVHLNPELRGEHWRASLDDLTTYCRSHHGSVDAPRAHAARAG